MNIYQNNMIFRIDVAGESCQVLILKTGLFTRALDKSTLGRAGLVFLIFAA